MLQECETLKIGSGLAMIATVHSDLLFFLMHISPITAGNRTAVLRCSDCGIRAGWSLPRLLPRQKGQKGPNFREEVLPSRQDLWRCPLQNWDWNSHGDGSLREAVEGEQSTHCEFLHQKKISIVHRDGIILRDHVGVGAILGGLNNYIKAFMFHPLKCLAHWRSLS